MSYSAQLEVLDRLYPGVAVLTVEQLAQVLSRTGRGAYEQTRRELDRGTLLPGLRKLGDRWLIPKVSVAELLDGLVVKPEVPNHSPRHRRRVAMGGAETVMAHAATQRRGGRRRSGNALVRSDYFMTLDVSLAVEGQPISASDRQEIRAFWSDVLALLPACSSENA